MITTAPVFQMPPKNAREQLDRAAKAVADEDAAGTKAIIDACGDEFKAPTDMAGAAKIIAKLRGLRDKATSEAKDAENRFLEFQKIVRSDCAEALAGTLTRAGSQFGPLASEIKSTREDRDKLRELHNAFSMSIRETMLDMKLTEIPGMTGYFTAATPMLRAAEAAATFICTTDRVVREAYLRRRGWKLSVNNTWLAPGDSRNSWPYETAVIRAVKMDCEPFAKLGTREWKGIAEGTKFEPKLNVDASNPSAKTAFTDLLSAPAETTAVSLTKPAAATWQERPDTAETTVIPRFEDGPEN